MNAVVCSCTPSRARNAAGACAGSRPSTDTDPDVAVRRPSRISTNVVLPAPFGPSKPMICPVAAIERSMPRSACTAP